MICDAVKIQGMRLEKVNTSAESPQGLFHICFQTDRETRIRCFVVGRCL